MGQTLKITNYSRYGMLDILTNDKWVAVLAMFSVQKGFIILLYSLFYEDGFISLRMDFSFSDFTLHKVVWESSIDILKLTK